MDEGRKADAGKARWDLVPYLALSRVVDVLTFGARKYAPENWRQLSEPRRRYFAAAMRHLIAWWRGERIDPESGLPHLACAISSLLFLLEREEEEARDDAA